MNANTGYGWVLFGTFFLRKVGGYPLLWAGSVRCLFCPLTGALQSGFFDPLNPRGFVMKIKKTLAR